MSPKYMIGKQRHRWYLYIDVNICFQGLALIQGQIYDPGFLKKCPIHEWLKFMGSYVINVGKMLVNSPYAFGIQSPSENGNET